MKRFFQIIAVVVIALLMVQTSAAQSPSSAGLTNSDIIKMTEGGLQESTVIGAIQANAANFDVSADALLALKKAGVNDKVIEAMLTVANKRTPSPAAAEVAPTSPVQTPAYASPMMPNLMSMMPPQALARMSPQARQQLMSSWCGGGTCSATQGTISPYAQLPKVNVIVDGASKALQPSTTQVAKSNMKGGGPGARAKAGSALSSFATQGLSFAAIGGGGMFAGPATGLATGLMGGGIPGLGHHSSMPTYTNVWALPGRNAATELSSHDLKFDVEYGDITGVDPDSYEVVLLQVVLSKDNWRLIGATHQKMDMKGRETTWVSDEQRIPVKLAKLGRGHVQLEPSTPLADGEYCVALRTVEKKKKSSSSYGTNTSADEEQMLQYTVWDFSVGSAAKTVAGK